MARKTSPPKASGGGGFTFEDKAAAWWMLHILAGRSPLDSDLPALNRIRFQARVDGWLLDDFVVDFPGSDGPIHAAVSVKSGEVIVAGKAPGELVRDCWTLYRNPGKTAFNASRDRLVLITGPLPRTTRRAIGDALSRATKAPFDLDRRIQKRGWSSEGVRKFVRSFRCPRALRKEHPKGANRIGPLLRAFRICDYDFEELDSDSEKDALRLCRELVAGRPAAPARALWLELNDIAKENRSKSGAVTLTDLLDRLRGRVRLKAHPDYAADWQQMQRMSAAWKQDTKDTIGATLHLSRAELKQKLSDAFRENRAVALVGESGSGKSVLVKDLTFRAEAVYCLNADDVVRVDSGAQPNRLEHRLEELLPTHPAVNAVLVLDRLDRLTNPDDFAIVAHLVRALRLDSTDSGWRLILISQSAAWNAVRDGFRGAGLSLSYEVIGVDRLDDDELGLVAREYPSLSRLLGRQELYPVVTRPKVLDLLATAQSEGAQIPGAIPLTGEASLIEWFWSGYLCSLPRDQRYGRLLMKVASKQADERRFATLLTELASDEVTLLTELSRLEIVFIRDETARFRHDLYADYARQRYLLGEWASGKRAELRTRVSNPLWHRAIRLLALRSVEQANTAAGIAEWKKIFSVLSENPLAPNGSADLPLEAIPFASNAGALLDALLPDLCANRGVLLRRFLSRFFYATTVQVLSEEQLRDLRPALRGEFAASFRTPQLLLWWPILNWIIQHREEVLRFASPEFLSIGELWVGYCRRASETAFLNEIEDLILVLAERVAGEEWSKFEQAAPGKSRVFLAAVCCDKTYRARIGALILRLSGRTAVPALPRSKRPRDIHHPLWSLSELDELGDPWPDGPLQPPDHEFQELALSPVGANLLVAFDPRLAMEVFLALLIEPPRRRSPFDRPWDHDYGIEWVRAANPPLYDFAPARELLAKAPAVGLDFVNRLINFATGRWAEGYRAAAATYAAEHGASSIAEPPQLKLNIGEKEERTYLGDGQVFFWHAGLSHATDAIEATLMALEHWLYEQADAGKLSADVIDGLLRGGRSAAMIGVLFSLGLKHPTLFEGPLEPLVGLPELYFWGYHPAIHSQTKTAMIRWGFEVGADRRNKALEWHSLPHRSVDFRRTVLQIFATKKLSWPAIERARQRWAAVRDAMQNSGSQDHLDELIAQFDSANWKSVTLPEGASGFLYEQPEKISRRNELARERSEEGLRRLGFPWQCRQILDGEAKISESDLAEILRYAESAGAVSHPDDHSADQAITIRCGAAAVACIDFPDWLAQHVEWKQRCRDWLVSACVAPRMPAAWEKRNQIMGGCSWDSFCADALPSVWAEDLNNLEFKRAMAALVQAPHNEAVARIYRTSAKHRLQSFDEFRRLLHMGVRIARIEAIGWSLNEADKPKLDRERERLSSSFVDGSLEPLPDGWPAIAADRPEGLAEAEATRVASPLDNAYLLSVFSWLIDEAANAAALDREFLLRSVSALTGLVSERVVSLVQQRRGRRDVGTPRQEDYSIATIVAAYLVHEPDAMRRRGLFEPWLALPPEGHDWTEILLEDIYRCGMDLAPTDLAPCFVPAICEVFDFLISDQGVIAGRSVFSDCGVVWALLGFQRFPLSRNWQTRWPDERKAVAAVLKARWKRCAEIALCWPGCAERLMALLATPAGKSLRVEALAWLASSELPKWLADHSSQEELIGLLEMVWADNSDDILTDPDARKSFETLLQVLTDKQIPRAIVLSHLLTRTSPI